MKQRKRGPSRSSKVARIKDEIAVMKMLVSFLLDSGLVKDKAERKKAARLLGRRA